jgi:hypothetical protein
VGKVGCRREGGEQRMEERMENVGEDRRREGRGASVLGGEKAGEEGEAPEWLDERKEERRRREWREKEVKRMEERRRGREMCVGGRWIRG